MNAGALQSQVLWLVLETWTYAFSLQSFLLAWHLACFSWAVLEREAVLPERKCRQNKDKKGLPRRCISLCEALCLYICRQSRGWWPPKLGQRTLLVMSREVGGLGLVFKGCFEAKIEVSIIIYDNSMYVCMYVVNLLPLLLPLSNLLVPSQVIDSHCWARFPMGMRLFVGVARLWNTGEEKRSGRSKERGMVPTILSTWQHWGGELDEVLQVSQFHR